MDHLTLFTDCFNFCPLGGTTSLHVYQNILLQEHCFFSVAIRFWTPGYIPAFMQHVLNISAAFSAYLESLWIITNCVICYIDVCLYVMLLWTEPCSHAVLKTTSAGCSSVVIKAQQHDCKTAVVGNKVFTYSDPENWMSCQLRKHKQIVYRVCFRQYECPQVSHSTHVIYFWYSSFLLSMYSERAQDFFFFSFKLHLSGNCQSAKPALPPGPQLPKKRQKKTISKVT